MKINPTAGQLGIPSDLVDIPKLITAYYDEWHIPTITQAICLYRRQQKIESRVKPALVVTSQHGGFKVERKPVVDTPRLNTSC